MAVGMVRSGNKIYQYYGGLNWGHGVRASKKDKFTDARPPHGGEFRCILRITEQALRLGDTVAAAPVTFLLEPVNKLGIASRADRFRDIVLEAPCFRR